MTIPRIIVKFVADVYTVCVLALSTSAFFPVLVSGNDPTDVAQGARPMQAAWALVFAITVVRLIRRRNQLMPLIRANKPLVSLVLLPFVSVLWSIDRSATLHAAVILALSALFGIDLSIRYTFVRQIRLICIALTLVIGVSVFVELFLPGFVPGNEFKDLRGMVSLEPRTSSQELSISESLLIWPCLVNRGGQRLARSRAGRWWQCWRSPPSAVGYLACYCWPLYVVVRTKVETQAAKDRDCRKHDCRAV